MKQLETVKIPMHSLIDLITNSSTEIFVNSEKSLGVCKDLVNEFLKVIPQKGDLLTCDDIFELSIEYTPYIIDNYKEWVKYGGDGDFDEDDEKSIKRACKQIDDYVAGKIPQPDWWNTYHVETKLVIKAKNLEYVKLAELFKDFLYSGDYFEHSTD